MNPVPIPIASRLETRIFKVSIAVLVLSGLAQMPLFKRYYISEIPGMAWTADYYFNHVLHYAAAAVLLFVIFKRSATYLGSKKNRQQLTISGMIRIGLFSLIIITGFLRAIKNMQDYYFTPAATTSIIWIHLASGVLLGIMAGYAFLARKRYLKPVKH